MDIILTSFNLGPGSWGAGESRNDLSLEGKILQGISLENFMVRFGDRGKVKAPDCRVLHSLLYGTPKLSWRQIVMITHGIHGNRLNAK